KPKNRELINNCIEDNSLLVVFNSNLLSINDESCIYKVNDQEDSKQVKNDLVYIFAGGELPTKFLEKPGVKITKRFGYIMKKHS
ncbi:MAG: 4Fe-4S ferredoxin, partial [Flavobacteriaceae bacterium]|nr:4Fe-4S ferredoxin [Flavobacteriaceae bacterium]